MTNKKIEKIPDGEPWEYRVNFNSDEATLFINELDDIKQDNPLFFETLSKIFGKVKIEVIPKGEETTNELNEMAVVIPANVNSFRFSSTKLTNSLISSPIGEVLATNYGVNV